MKTNTNLLTALAMAHNTSGGIRLHFKRTLQIALAALITLFTVGLTAPSATAAEPSTESVYKLSVNGQEVTFAEGQSATFSLQAISSGSAFGLVYPSAVYHDNAGTLTVTGSNGRFHYSIDMSIPATGFNGVFTVTDLTSGQSGGSTAVSGFSGTVPTSNLRGHRYAGSLTGTANLLGIPVAKTVWNYTVFTNR